MKIATWNVNSLNVRLPHVLEWLGSAQPEILVLQEIKQLTEAFDSQAFADLIYNGLAVVVVLVFGWEHLIRTKPEVPCVGTRTGNFTNELED